MMSSRCWKTTLLLLWVAVWLFELPAFPMDKRSNPQQTRKLIDAVKRGDLKAVRQELSDGVDVNGLDQGFYTPLHWAVERQHLDVTLELLKQGADVKAMHYQDGTPLHIAALRGPAAIVSALLKSGAPVNVVIRAHRATPLHAAAQADHPDIAKILIKAGAKMESGSSTPLTIVSQHGSLKAMKVLLAAGAKVNIKKNPPLHWARNAKVIRLLVRSGADVRHKDENGRTALHLSSGPYWGPKLNGIKTLISLGAEVMARDRHGSTPLHEAVRAQRPDMVQFLVKSGADPQARDDQGKTPVALAQKNKDRKALVAMGQPPTVQKKPLESAAAKGDLKSAQTLIASGINLDEKNVVGQTALHIASQNGHLDIVRALLQAKCRVDVADDKGQRPLHLAKDQSIAKALIDAGAIPVQKNESLENSPLFAAAVAGREGVVDLLLDRGYQAIPKGLLTWTVFHGRLKVMKLLVKRRANVNEDIGLGQSPLHVAAAGGLGDTPCPAEATPAARLAMAQHLLKSGANPKARCQHGLFGGFTPLHGAAAKGDEALARLLIQHKAPVDARGEGQFFSGLTPLHFAVKTGNLKLVQLLIQSGAQVNALTKSGSTFGVKAPLDLATTARMSELLKTHGGKKAMDLKRKQPDPGC